MKLLDKKTTLDLTKLLIFMVVTTLATGVLVVTIGNITFAATTTYKAVFADATGVNKGDDIRVAGVKVGTVKDVAIIDRTRALVTFSVDDATPVTEATHATIKYRNLVGQRYIALTQEVGGGERCAEGATIPIARTAPALDLTVLFNGFKPLFQALTPADINQLSYEIDPGVPGRGRHAREPAGPHRVGDQHAGRPRPGDQRPDRQPQRGARPRRRPRRAAQPADHDLPHVRRRPQAATATRSSARWTRSPQLSVQTAALVKGIRSPLVDDIASLRTLTANIDSATAPSSTARCRCCRSSSRRSAGPRSTARGSTSTSASSRARSSCPGSAVPVDLQRPASREV